MDLAGTAGEYGQGLPAVTRATSLICDTLAGLPWEVYRGREKLDTPRWITDPALARPDLRVSAYAPDGVAPKPAVAFWSEVLISALHYGDAFIWVPVRDANGAPVPPLFILHPLLVEVVTAADTDARRPDPGYWVDVSGGTQWERIPRSDLIHVRGMGPYWNGRGRGAITGHKLAWAEGAALRAYSTGLFTAGVPAGYLKVTAPNLTSDQAEALKSKWAESHGGGKRQVAVLNASTEFVPIQMTPETAQLVEGKRLTTLDVANAFGVEPFMLGLPSDGSTYANIESRMRSFAQMTLQPWARRLESALDAELPQGTTVKAQLDGLARADSATRVSYYSTGLADGWLTVDEVRAMEDLPPMEPHQEPRQLEVVPPADTPKEGQTDATA
jgi:HK97 family phage portal protein